MPKLDPLPLTQIPQPFDSPDFVFEVKFDGLRALAFAEGDGCQLVSRKGIRFERYVDLASELGLEAQCRNAIIDGELLCLPGPCRGDGSRA